MLKTALAFGVVGLIVPVLIVIWGQVSTSGLPPFWFHIIWPTEILLIPFAGPFDAAKIAATVFSAVLNGLIYAVLGTLIGWVAGKRHRPTNK